MIHIRVYWYGCEQPMAVKSFETSGQLQLHNSTRQNKTVKDQQLN